jgi:dynein heavy chain
MKDSINYNLESKDGAYQYFVSRVRDNLRIVLCFSPVGDNFRKRCLQFPSIINCCTIDWFNIWPNDALFSVADRYLNSNNAISNEEGMVQKLSNIFLKAHSNVFKIIIF